MNLGGRPLKFKTVEDLQSKIDDYFRRCESTIIFKKYDKDGNVIVELPTPPTITGLALALDTTRETLLDYEEKDGYSDAIKRAKLRCQNAVEENALVGTFNSTAAIFNLKNNFGWKDRTEIDHTTKGKEIGLMSPAQAKNILDAVNDSNPKAD